MIERKNWQDLLKEQLNHTIPNVMAQTAAQLLKILKARLEKCNSKETTKASN